MSKIAPSRVARTMAGALWPDVQCQLDVAPWARATTTDELHSKAKAWARMLAAALERRDLAAASGYSRHLVVMTDELRRRSAT